MALKKTLVELVLSTLLLVGCNTPLPQNKQKEFPKWLYSQIERDIQYILEKGKEDKEIRCKVNNKDLYHVHACLKKKNEKGNRITINELASTNIILLYHSRELLPIENFKRNMFHYPDESWDMQRNIDHKGIYPEDMGLKSVTIYFGKTKAELMEHPVKKATIRGAGDYYFGISEVFPFLKYNLKTRHP